MCQFLENKSKSVNGVVLTLVFIFWGLFPAAAKIPAPGSDQFPPQATLGDYLVWATTHNPSLLGNYHRVQALHQKAVVAGSLPDLKLSWNEMIVPVETRVGPQQRAFSISQTIPWFGTLGVRQDAVLARAGVESSRLEERAVSLQHSIREVWYQLALVQAEVDILNEHLLLARQEEISIRTSYEAGSHRYGNLLKAQMELGRLEIRLENLADRFLPLTIKLNNLAGLGLAQPMPIADLDPPQIDSGILADKAILIELMARRNPGLQAEHGLLAAARHGQELAGKQGKPDLILGLDYIMTGQAVNPAVIDSGKDPVIARLAVSIPLWGGKASAGRAASAELVYAADSSLDNLKLELASRLEDALYRARSARRNRRLYGETLLTRARQDLVVVTAAYKSGQLEFEDLLEARRNLLGIELARIHSVSDHSRALNDLVTLLGGEIVGDLPIQTVPALKEVE